MSATRRIHRLCAAPAALLALCLSFIAAPAAALQLQWSGGATDLSLSQSTRAMLVLQADPGQSKLPGSWRLQWVADSSGIHFPAVDAAAACPSDTANTGAIVPPATPADSAANLSTAYFCSSGSPVPTAYYLVDLVAGSRGKLRVIALNPSDTTQTIVSNEVTFGGGIDGDFAPAILATVYAHADTQLVVSAVGAGLAAVASTSLEAADGTWSFPLALSQRSDALVTATGTTAAAVPECVLNASLENGPTLQAPVSAESPNLPMTPLFLSEMYDPDPNFYPKDFALVYTPGKFHVIYIRHNAWERSHGGAALPDSLNERAFGHRWTSDWVNWNQDAPPADTTLLTTLDGTWDDTHVWAPTIVQQGLEFYMFYTGVHDDPITGFRVQKMGLARSFDLSHWTRNGDPVNSVNDVFWADQSIRRELPFRDPFVMRDPTRPSGWLMYFVATMRDRVPQMAVGAAQSVSDTLGGRWTNLTIPLYVTDNAHTFGGGKAESPHVFWDHGSWQLLFTTGSGHPISIATNPGVPIDTVASDSANWATTRLYYELLSAGESSSDAATVDRWSATEYLSVFGREFLGAYDGVGIRIQEMHWLGTTPDYFSLTDVAADANRDDAAGPRGLALSYAGANPIRGGARLRVEAGRGANARVALYDVTGRRVKVLWDGLMPVEKLTLTWDGRDSDGRAVGSGIYFARLSCREGSASLRVPLLW